MIESCLEIRILDIILIILISIKFSATLSPKIQPHEHAAIEKIIEDLSSQLSRIKQYAVEDESEMETLRTQNNSLKGLLSFYAFLMSQHLLKVAFRKFFLSVLKLSKSVLMLKLSDFL